MHRAAAFLTLACLGACSSVPAGDPAVIVELDFSHTRAQCGQVHLSIDGMASPSTPSIARKSDVVPVVIAHAITQSERLELSSTGCLACDCTHTNVIATSPPVKVTLTPAASTANRVRLVLADLDNPKLDGGGPDAGMPDGGSCTPGGGEICNNGKDDNCDGLLDCADSTCLGKGCQDSNACTQNDRCIPGGLCGGDPVNCSAMECVTNGNACMPATGCSGTPLSNTPCAGDAGVCTLGTCEHFFPFVPSNGLGNLHVKVSPTLPAAQLNCGLTTYDSSTDTFTNWCGDGGVLQSQTVAQQGAENLRVLAVRSLTIAHGSSLRLVGNRPVAMAVFGDADIQGRIAVDADGGVSGPGWYPSVCNTNFGNGSPASTSSAGGGGGAYGRAGGKGGKNAGTNVEGGAGGKAFGDGTPQLTPLHGGCPGGAGSGVMVSGSGGAEGGAGGALQLSVSGLLRVSGVISANGGGGQGGRTTEAGGGGGGSGGALLLEAARIQIIAGARIVAHGGAGGSGSQISFGVVTNGVRGEDGHSEDFLPARGGNVGGAGEVAGEGGNGDARDNTAKDGRNGDTGVGRSGGGGGGGGGAGRVFLRAPSCSIDKDTVFPASAPGGGC